MYCTSNSYNYISYYVKLYVATDLQSDDSDEEGYVINTIDHEQIQAQYLRG